MTLEEEIDELIEKENNGVGSIDLFFDYMKTRTCENCKYSRGVRSSRYNSEVDARHCTVLNQKVQDNFGCNKFKRKDK